MVNIYMLCLCLLIPLVIAALIMPRDRNSQLIFSLIVFGMLACILTGFIVTFLTRIYDYSIPTTNIYVRPFVAETLKALVLLIWVYCLKPHPNQMFSASVCVGAGFALLNNAIFLMSAPIDDYSYVLEDGLNKGVVSICCTALFGALFYSLRDSKRMRVCGSMGALYFSITMDGLFSLLANDQAHGKTLSSLLAVALILLLLYFQREGGKIVHDKMKAKRLVLSALVMIIAAFTFCAAGILLMQKKIDSPEKSDVMIVLGTGLQSDDTFNDFQKYRLERALQLYEDDYAPMIIVSGGVHNKNGVTESQVMKKWLMENGISEEKIIQENASTDTRTNVTLSKQIMQERGMHNALIVTTDLHLARVLLYADQYDLPASGAAADNGANLIECISLYSHEFISWMQYLSSDSF